MRRSILLALVAVGLLWPGSTPATASLSEDRLILSPLSDDTIFTIEGVPPKQPADICAAHRRPTLRAKYRGTLEITPAASFG